jgi:hypothetical protein
MTDLRSIQFATPSLSNPLRYRSAVPRKWARERRTPCTYGDRSGIWRSVDAAGGPGSVVGFCQDDPAHSALNGLGTLHRMGDLDADAAAVAPIWLPATGLGESISAQIGGESHGSHDCSS